LTSKTMGFWWIQLLKCSYALYVVPYPTENYKQWLHNGRIPWLFIDLPPFWPLWCKYSGHVPCSCSLEFHFDLINLSHDVSLSPSLKHSLFSTLRCCGWAYGYTLMLYYMCRWGWILGKRGYGRDCMMLQCHGWCCKPPLTASHIHIGCIQSDWAPWDAVEGIWVHTYAVLYVQVGVKFRYVASMGGPLCHSHNPILRLFSRTCLHTTRDDSQTRPKHTIQRPNKHHHHGGGAAPPTPQVTWIWWTHVAWGVGGLAHDFSKDAIKAI
jgi:hypothetical protein